MRVRDWVAVCFPDGLVGVERVRRPPSCLRVGSEDERRRLRERGIGELLCVRMGIWGAD